MLILLVTALIFLLIPNTAEAALYFDVLGHIAEDIEEIHEDMHMLVFILCHMAWASVANAVLIAVSAVALFASRGSR